MYFSPIRTRLFILKGKPGEAVTIRLNTHLLPPYHLTNQLKTSHLTPLSPEHRFVCND